MHSVTGSSTEIFPFGSAQFLVTSWSCLLLGLKVLIVSGRTVVLLFSYITAQRLLVSEVVYTMLYSKKKISQWTRLRPNLVLDRVSWGGDKNGMAGTLELDGIIYYMEWLHMLLFVCVCFVSREMGWGENLIGNVRKCFTSIACTFLFI
jgi:hypothetical protein